MYSSEMRVGSRRAWLGKRHEVVSENSTNWYEFPDDHLAIAINAIGFALRTRFASRRGKLERIVTQNEMGFGSLGQGDFAVRVGGG